jgi:hypothetical protein
MEMQKMPFTLSQNTAREIQSAFEAFQKSETLATRQFEHDLHAVHIKSAMAYSFLRAEAEDAGVSLSSSTLWKGTAFAGKEYKDYRAFMAIVADHQKDVIAMVAEKNITSWRYALQAWKKANRATKETAEETWEDALFKLMDKFEVSGIEIAEYLMAMEEKGNGVMSSKAALDVVPLTTVDPAKMKTKVKAA